MQMAKRCQLLCSLLWSPTCTKAGHHKRIDDAMARVAVALCDTVVRVTAGLVMMATTEHQKDFFGHDMEGSTFTQLIHAEDVGRFAEMVLRVSSCHVPECMETKVRLASAAVDATLLVVGAGGADEG